MSDKVIVFVADEKYLPHYKSLAVNCRNMGQYDGDFLWICPDTSEPWIEDLLRRGFRVLPVSDKGFLAKFNIFHPSLREWEQALFMDADSIVQLPLQPLFDQLTAWPREIVGVSYGEGKEMTFTKQADQRRRIIANREEVPVFMGWQVWDKEWKAHTEIYESMRGRFPHVFSTDKMWSTATLLYEPESIPEDTVEKLRLLQEEFVVCNDPAKGGTDEQIIDLLLHDHMAQVGEKGWCYWGLDEPESRVHSLARGWRGDEIPIIVHYTRWYAPWLVKKPDVNAYINRQLNRPCHEIYAENLSRFDETFPITEGDTTNAESAGVR